MSFAEWLAEQIQEREWSQNRLGVEAHLSNAEISRVMNGKKPSYVVCKAIADALNLSIDLVLKEAGLETKPPGYDSESQELLAKILQLSDSNKREVKKLLDLKIEIQKETDHAKKKKKDG